MQIVHYRKKILTSKFYQQFHCRFSNVITHLPQWLHVELKLHFLSIFLEEDPDSSVARARHRQKRGLLKLYYGVGDEPGETPINPCDINGAHFKPDAYMEKLLKEKSLTELMDKETDITKRKDFTERILVFAICFCRSQQLPTFQSFQSKLLKRYEP